MFDFWHRPAPRNATYTPLSQNATDRLKELASKYKEEPIHDGLHYVAEFPNGYGISIIKHYGSYGGPEDEFEIAVLKDGGLYYDTEITNDVIGWLSESEVMAYAMRIYKL